MRSSSTLQMDQQHGNSRYTISKPRCEQGYKMESHRTAAREDASPPRGYTRPARAHDVPPMVRTRALCARIRCGGALPGTSMSDTAAVAVQPAPERPSAEHGATSGRAAAAAASHGDEGGGDEGGGSVHQRVGSVALMGEFSRCWKTTVDHADSCMRGSQQHNASKSIDRHLEGAADDADRLPGRGVGGRCESGEWLPRTQARAAPCEASTWRAVRKKCIAAEPCA